MAVQFHVLLVEDDRDLLTGVCDLLTEAGYQVSCATNGIEALELLREAAVLPDLIVSDIRMPEMDGYDLLMAVRGNPDWLSIPFIFLTAKGEKKDILDGKLRGADDYLPKPFEYQDLLVAVQSAINRHRELLALQESRMEALKRRILTVLNHEFRTPLSFIVAYADLMASSPYLEHSEELRQYINGILDGSERLTRLIDSFLLLAELESDYGRKTYEQRKTTIRNLDNLVESAVQAARSCAARRGVKLVFNATPPIPPVQGDAVYLRAAIGHLIDNAIKFSPPNKDACVTVEVWADEEHLTVAVRDQGAGIPLAAQKRLFEMFYQVNRDEYEQQGIGAGLAIVKHIADLHRGQIELESAPGEGSCFRLLLPC